MHSIRSTDLEVIGVIADMLANQICQSPSRKTLSNMMDTSEPTISENLVAWREERPAKARGLQATDNCEDGKITRQSG